MASKRALIVDDSTTAQYRLKKMLQSYDLDIDVVSSGEAALLYLAKHVPDVIFMDHLMPGMDGFRVLQIIKSHPETAMIPVIMYTSQSGDVYTGQARALGALDVITKDAISAVELSKVMAGIHIARKPSAEHEHLPSDENPTEQITHAKFQEAVQENPLREVTTDNARRIELRIVQLEHAIDDSRRVSAAQLIREMQKLRHGLKQELTTLLKKALGEKSAVTAQESVAQTTPLRGNRLLSVAVILGLILLVIVLFRQSEISQQLQQLQAQQQPQIETLEQLSHHLLDVQVDILNQQNASKPGSSIKADPVQWEDLVWAINQSGQLPFSPRLMESNIAVRLHEFISRLARQGFRGSIGINLTFGNFCVQLNNSGLVQLPHPESSVHECMLMSEVYPFQSLAYQALEDLRASLEQHPAVAQGKIVIFISSIEDQSLNYPPRDAPILASDWNRIAQSLNRLRVTLRDFGAN